MKIVMDTNALISALLWQGPPNDILKLAQKDKFDLYTTPLLLEELFEVLHRDKFFRRIAILNTSVQELTDGIIRFFTIIPDKKISPIVKNDPDDDIVLSCAKFSQTRYIVTGDPHLLKLKSWSGISILTPRQFLDKFLSQK